MTKKKYTKPACICERLNMRNLLVDASVELKTTSGLASDSYEILSKESSWYEEEDDFE
jgi:hypothetical protein